MRSIASMRNAFLFVSIAICSSLFVSCTKNAPSTPANVPSTPSETYLYTAASSDWSAPITGDYTWEYFVYVPGINAYTLGNKAILVYYQDLNQNSTETLMPFTLNGIDYTYVTGIDNT